MLIVQKSFFETDRDPFLKDIARTVWKRAWVVVLTALVFVGVAVGVGLSQEPVYEASAEILVAQTEDSNRTSSLGSDIQGLQQATQTVAAAVSSRPVMDDVIQQQGLEAAPETLLNNTDVKQVQATQFVGVTYSDPDPVEAQKVANSISDVAAKRISESSAEASGIRATIWEYAEAPGTPAGPDPIRNAILALGLGLMLGVGLTFLLEYLDDSWRSQEEVEQISGVPNFGIIPNFDSVKRIG